MAFHCLLIRANPFLFGSSMRELLVKLTESLNQGRDCIYCCVVETRGSTPQKAGAAMLVFADGSQQGTLGGGCVEAEVKQRALAALNNSAGQAEILTYCLDDNYGWDDGLICAQLAAEPAPAEVAINLTPLEKRPKPYMAHGIVYLPVLPRITLLIVGGGHVG